MFVTRDNNGASDLYNAPLAVMHLASLGDSVLGRRQNTPVGVALRIDEPDAGR